ncbi:acetyltransferase [Curtobacterium sp. MCPF17_001]|nr:acetyltransferase [Curtobacterium sp. MCPF17_001]
MGSIIWAPTRLEIGNDVYVGKNCTLQFDGEIGDGVLIANNVGVVGRRDHDIRQIGVTIRRARWVGDSRALSSQTRIGDDVWIGFGAIVLSGISIGRSSIVGAGALVTKDVPENSIVRGSPAVVVGRRFDEDEYREHLRLLADETD